MKWKKEGIANIKPLKISDSVVVGEIKSFNNFNTKYIKIY